VLLTCAGLASSLVMSRMGDRIADPGDVIDQALRRALVLTLGFYVVLGVALALFCLYRKVGLVWVRGDVTDALILGLPLGLVGGLLAVGLNSAVNGHLTSDPNVELLVGGGGGLRIALTLVVTACLAPLVEETLFRGVLAGTLLGKSTGLALTGSAIAFAVWHMNLVSLRYYFFMGLLLGWLWLKRGLVSSMAAHAAFNGVLTLAAVMATGGSGHTVQIAQLSFSMPGGWHAVDQLSSSDHLIASGPAGAAMDVRWMAAPAVVTEAELAQRFLTAQAENGFQLDRASVHPVKVPGATAVCADFRAVGQPGHVCQLQGNGRLYQVQMLTSGSPSAERNWQHVLATARIG
jgi:membrane protease YdiL (CAAX protease family)